MIKEKYQSMVRMEFIIHICMIMTSRSHGMNQNKYTTHLTNSRLRSCTRDGENLLNFQVEICQKSDQQREEQKEGQTTV